MSKVRKKQNRYQNTKIPTYQHTNIWNTTKIRNTWGFLRTSSFWTASGSSYVEVHVPTAQYFRVRRQRITVSSAWLLVVSRVRRGRRKYRGPAAFTFCGCLWFLRPFRLVIPAVKILRTGHWKENWNSLLSSPLPISHQRYSMQVWRWHPWPLGCVWRFDACIGCSSRIPEYQGRVIC